MSAGTRSITRPPSPRARAARDTAPTALGARRGCPPRRCSRSRVPRPGRRARSSPAGARSRASSVPPSQSRARRGSRAPWSRRPPRWRRRGPVRPDRPGSRGRSRCAGAGLRIARSRARRVSCRSRRADRRRIRGRPRVLPHGVRKQERVLEDQRDRSSDVHEPQLPQIDAVEQDATVVGVVEPGEQACDGALPRAGGADERERLAGRHMEVEAVEDRDVAGVAETHALEADVAAGAFLEVPWMTPLAQPRLRLQHLRDPCARREGALHRRHALAEDAERPDEHDDVGVERDERAEAEVAGDHAAAAEPEDDEEPEQREQLERRHEDGVDARDVEPALDDPVALLAEARAQRSSGAEALDDADPADRLLRERRRTRQLLLEARLAVVVALRVRPAGCADQRQGQQHDEGEADVDRQEDDRDGDHREDVADRVADGVQQPRDLLGVRGGAAHQLAGAYAIVVGRVEPEGVGEDRVTDAGVAAGPVPDSEDVPRCAGEHLEQADAEQRERPEQECPPVAREDPVVDRARDDQRRGHGAHLPGETRQCGADDAVRLRAEDGAQEPPGGRTPRGCIPSGHGGKYPVVSNRLPIEQRFPRPSVMGVVNVTPDSFSDGGVYLQPVAAVAAGWRMLDEGAAIIDVGGESTRPGSEGVGLDEELRRVVPVLEGLHGAPLSIDTAKAEVARRALELGAELVNDVTALRGDSDMAEVVAEADAYLCLMHMQGEPRTMQLNPTYDEVVSDVTAFLEQRLRFATDAGVSEDRICLDPGIGFGKTVEQN